MLRHRVVAAKTELVSTGKKVACLCLDKPVEPKRAQVVLIRQAQLGVVLVKPVNQHLQTAPCVEAGRPRIGMRQCLCLARRLMQAGPFGLKEGEVAHGVRLIRSSNSRTASMMLANKGGSVKNIGCMAR